MRLHINRLLCGLGDECDFDCENFGKKWPQQTDDSPVATIPGKYVYHEL